METIPDEDVQVEHWTSRPPGGQHVGTSMGVKVTHLPTGLIACCEVARSQHLNRRIALDMILGALTSPDFR